MKTLLCLSLFAVLTIAGLVGAVAFRLVEKDPFLNPLLFLNAINEPELRYGFVDHSGGFVVPPSFDDANAFSEGLAAVKVGSPKWGLWGYINKEGKFQIPVQFDNAGQFGGGLALVSTGGLQLGPYGKLNAKYAVINREGRYKLAPDSVGSVPSKKDQLFRARLATDVISPFGWIHSESFFNEGLAWVLRKDKLAAIDQSGKVVIPANFVMASKFNEGLAVVAEKECHDTVFGYIDKSGKYVIHPRFRQAQEFSDGLAAVSEDGDHWGFINMAGSFVIPPRYTFCKSFQDGLALAKDEHGLFGFIDKNGKTIIGHQFKNGSSFSDGLAHVVSAKGDQGIFIDKNGEKLMQLPERAASRLQAGEHDFHGGFLRCDWWEGSCSMGFDRNYGMWIDSAPAAYFDKSGKLVFKAYSSEPHYEHRKFDFHEGLALLWVPDPSPDATQTRSCRDPRVSDETVEKVLRFGHGECIPYLYETIGQTEEGKHFIVQGSIRGPLLIRGSNFERRISYTAEVPFVVEQIDMGHNEIYKVNNATGIWTDVKSGKDSRQLFFDVTHDGDILKVTANLVTLYSHDGTIKTFEFQTPISEEVFDKYRTSTVSIWNSYKR